MAGTPTGPSRATRSDRGVEVGHLPPAWQPATATPSLPIGVAVISFLVGLLGLVLLLAGGLFLLSYYTAGAFPSSLLIVHSIEPFGAALLVVLGAVLLALATALWRQELWALYTTVLIVFGVLAFLFFTDFITYLFLVLLAVFIYLLAVRHHFY
ncbi:MAG TPA: hypothetical protein VLY85_03485 [Thermoplasmata archaeon]|nr:hypothetical protein [Thermoplasmata archaeon]